MTAIGPDDAAVIVYTHPDGSQSTVRVIGQSDSIRVDLTVPTGKAYNIGCLCLADATPIPGGCPECGRGFINEDCPNPYHQPVIGKAEQERNVIGELSQERMTAMEPQQNGIPHWSSEVPDSGALARMVYRERGNPDPSCFDDSPPTTRGF